MHGKIVSEFYKLRHAKLRQSRLVKCDDLREKHESQAIVVEVGIPRPNQDHLYGRREAAATARLRGLALRSGFDRLKGVPVTPRILSHDRYGPPS